MITVLFNRKQRTLEWPVPGGRRVIEAFSEVRNELNGKRPDPSRLPDVVHGIRSDRTLGPVVMPRPFPVGVWEIYGVEDSTEKWTAPAKVLTRASQMLDVWTDDYARKTGTAFSDWGYWIHYANGSHNTEGCIGVVRLEDFKDFAAMVRNALAEGIPISVTAVSE